MNQFDEKSNEAHYAKANSSGDRNLLKFFALRLGTSFDKTHAVFGELPAGLDEHLDLIHFNLRMCLALLAQLGKG